mmetsp:Transcript_33481/g.42992  ORF Transcript_33481/g.42992 Transcript_33481/m.42992 type:complete len:804 (+) Transcript_33481:396-2807(+)
MIKKLSNLRRNRSRSVSRSHSQSSSRNSSFSSHDSQVADPSWENESFKSKSWNRKSRRDSDYSSELSDQESHSTYKGKVLKVFNRFSLREKGGQKRKKKKKPKNARNSLTPSENEFVSDDDGSSYYTTDYTTSASGIESGLESEYDEEVKVEPVHEQHHFLDLLPQSAPSEVRLQGKKEELDENPPFKGSAPVAGTVPPQDSAKENVFEETVSSESVVPPKKIHGQLQFNGGRKDSRSFVQLAQQYVPQLNLDNVYLLPVTVLKKLKQLPKFELCKKALKTAREVMYDQESRVLFVSHRWQKEKLPDEYNLHYDTILRFLAGHEDLGISHVWIDFSCLPQRQTHSNVLLRKNVATALFVADAFLVIPRFQEITSNPHTDLCGYCRRAWCQLELIVARLRQAPIYLFSFREHVVDFRLWPPTQTFRAIADQMASDYQTLASIEIEVDAATYDLPDITLEAAVQDVEEVIFEGTNNWQKQSLSTMAVRAATCQQFKCWEPLSETTRKQDKWLVVNLLVFVLLYAKDKLMSAHCQADFQGMVQQRCHDEVQPAGENEEANSDKKDKKGKKEKKEGKKEKGGKILELTNMELVPYDLERLLEATLKLHLHPSTLVICGNDCSGIGFNSFFSRRCDSIEKLVMEGESLTDLSFLTRHNFAKLESLSLGNNSIDAKGCRQLKLFLKEHPGLTSLILTDNKIGNTAAIELVQALTDHPSLEFLDLSKNMVASRGAHSLLTLARETRSLKKIDFSNNLVTPDECQFIANEWKKTRTDCLLALDIEMITPAPKKSSTAFRDMCVPLNCFSSS